MNNLYVQGEERTYPRSPSEKSAALTVPKIPAAQELKLLAWTIAVHEEPTDDDEVEAEVEEVEE
jgi:hypothetical protein